MCAISSLSILGGKNLSNETPIPEKVDSADFVWGTVSLPPDYPRVIIEDLTLKTSSPLGTTWATLLMPTL